MKLLRVIDTLNPRTGGPIAGLGALTPLLSARGVETTVVTNDTPPCSFTVAGARFLPMGPAKGPFRRSPALAPWLKDNLPGYDAVIVHALWQSHGADVHRAALRARVPYFVYPHGMLDPWFRRAYPLKHAKKWIYWQLVERRVLRDAAAVLYTCEEEKRLAATTFSPYRCTPRVVNYGAPPAPGDPVAQKAAWHAAQPALAGRPFWLFLGRLHPKKGVDLLLEAYADIASRNPAVPALVLAGPAEDEAYVATLRQRAGSLPAPASVHFPGLLQGDVKWGALRAAETFALPSHQENFGIAVAEALAVGAPVLVSTQVNIWREIISDGAGLAAPDTLAGARDLLERWMKLTASERETMRGAAAACHRARFHIDAVATSFLATLGEFVPAAIRRSP